jgi:hypothetical protein
MSVSDQGGPYPCPCCGYLTLRTRGTLELCPVCLWEDADADLERGGLNHVGLSRARDNFMRFGVSELSLRRFARPPTAAERPRG